ncbi:MAG: bacteriocin system transporter, ATP-binding protein [Candidatus Solibacter sp.]|nr:bacteriocin system transporter, ATP-binding protein [Candidatus Solibacter sp.]
MTREPRWFAGNQTLPLNAETPPGLLVSGSIAVFAVDKETGERLHLFSIEAGEPVLPIACPADSLWQVVAVSLEPSCVESPENEPDWAVIFALENWLAKIGEAVSRFCPAGEIQPAAPGTLVLAPGQRIGIDEGILFVRLDAGEGLLTGTRVGAGSVIALVPGIWLETAGEANWNALEGAPDDTLTSTASILTATIDRITPFFVSAMRDYRMRREDEDRRRFTERREVDNRMMAGAVGMLSGVGAPRAPRDELHSDPLLAALHAVAGALGVTLRPSPQGGRAPDRLREIAEASGVRARTVLLSGKWWRGENGPLLAYQFDGSPVALLPASTGFFGGARYQIFDPAAGTRHSVDEPAAAGLNAFARMIYPPLPEDLSTKNLFRHLLAPRRRELRTILLAGAAAALLALVVPQGAAFLIGMAIPDADTNMVWQIAAGMAAAAFGSAVFLLAQAMATLRAQTAAFQTLQSGVWDYLLKLSPRFFRDFSAGQLRQRADAVTRIHQLLTADALRSLFAGAAAFPSVALIFWYSRGLALIALVCGALVITATWLGSRALFRVQARWQEMEEVLAGLVLQAIQAVSKLRVAGAANRAFSHWATHYSRKQKYAAELRQLRDLIRLINMVMPAAATTLAFFWLLGNPIALGPFLACMAALTTFLAAVTTASDTCIALVHTANLWQRMRTILAGEPEVHTARTHPGRLRGAIAVENVTFRYRNGGPLILDSVSVRASPGECIALTGPSGSGKSTLLNLLLRFENPHSGAIYYDGRELSSLDITAVRRQIGVVTQDGRVMSGSILENICGGGIHNMDSAWEAARAAGLAQDIEQMPMGMHTRVSDGGGNLSGGQRQRLLIARALVFKPSILIFDEATSALDNRTQAIVAESLKRLKATRVLVAHRLSTLRSADRIYVIEKGRVVQQGTYHQLIAESGLFARLVSRQKV